MTEPQLRIVRVGWRAQLTDLGRSNVELSGVPTGGAADQYSAAVANILVGNNRDSVLIELIGPLTLQSSVEMLVAVTGAPAEVRIAGASVQQWAPVLVPAGQQLQVGAGHGALRTYLAVAGDLDAARFLNSAAPDPRMGFQQQLTSGTVLNLRGPDRLAGATWPDPVLFLFQVPRFVPPGQPWRLRVVPAAEHDQVLGIHQLMATSSYTVRPESDHVGVRLRGPAAHPDGPEIVSHGVPIGAVEIPHADNELILLGRYRTLTAGYPIVGVVCRTDLDLIGQLVPGQMLRFSWISRTEAVALAAEREAALISLERAVQTAFDAAGIAHPDHSPRVNDMETAC